MERDDTNIKKLTFAFYDEDDRLIEIKVPAKTVAEGEGKVRAMIPDSYFDDGLFLNNEEPY